MPTIRYEIRSEYALADPELLRAADKDDPEAVLEGVAMSGLVGVLRQLGDLAEFATEIFHELHEEVMCTAARGHGLKLRVQQLEAEFPPVENTFFSHPTHSSFTYNEGTDWHANIQMEQNLITQGDMPRFILDSYEECRGPPRLFMLDKFDIAGAGACLKRYSDPSFFKTQLTSCGMNDVDIRKEKKLRKVKKKTSHGKLGQTLESLLSPNAESSSGLLVPSDVSAKPIKRLVKLKSRVLDRSKEIKMMEHLLELHSDIQKVVLDSSRRQFNGKVQLENANDLTSKIHDVVTDKSVSHPLPNDEYLSTFIDGDKMLTQTYTLDHQKIEDDLPQVSHVACEMEETGNKNHLAVQNEIMAESNINDHASCDAERTTFPKDKVTITSLEVIKLTPTYELEYQMIEDEPEISHETACKVKEVEKNMHPGDKKIVSDSMTKSGNSFNDDNLDDAGTITFPRDEKTDEVIRSTPIYELEYEEIEDELPEALDKATCEVEDTDKNIHQQGLNQVMADSQTMSCDSVNDYQFSDTEKTTLLRYGDVTTSMDESIRSMTMNKTDYQKIENALPEELHKEEAVNIIHFVEHKELITHSETKKGDSISIYEFNDSKNSILSHVTDKTLNDGDLKLKSTGDDDRSDGIGNDLENFMGTLNSMESKVEVNAEKKDESLSVDEMCLDSDEVTNEHQVKNSELVPVEKTIAHLDDIVDDKTSCSPTSESLYTMLETEIIQEVFITSSLDRAFEMHLGEIQDNTTEELEVNESVISSAIETCDVEIFHGPGLRSDHMEASSYDSSVTESTSDLNICCQEYHDDQQTHIAMRNDISNSTDDLSERTEVARNIDGLPRMNIDLPGEFHPMEHMDGMNSEDKSGTNELFVCLSPTANHNSVSVISHTENSLVTAPGIREMQELDDKHEGASLGETTRSPDNVSTTSSDPHVLPLETPKDLLTKRSSEEVLSNGLEETGLANDVLGISLGEEVCHDCKNSSPDNHCLEITTHDMAVVSDQNDLLVDITDQRNEFDVGCTPDSLRPRELLVEDKKRCSSEVPDLNFSLPAAIKDDLENTSANAVSPVEVEGIDEILNNQIKMSDAKQSERYHISDPEEHRAIEVDTEEDKDAVIDHVQPLLYPHGSEVTESLVVNLKSVDDSIRYSSEGRKQIEENAYSDEYSPENVAAKDEVANHDLSPLSSPDISCFERLSNVNSTHNTEISHLYDVMVHEKCDKNKNVSLVSQSIPEMTVQSFQQAKLDRAALDPHMQLLEELSNDKNVSLVHVISEVQSKSQSIVDDSEQSLDKQQGHIQRYPEQSHHGGANEEMFVSISFSSQSASLPEDEDIKSQASKEENLPSLGNLDEHIKLDTATVSSDIVTIPVEEPDILRDISGEHIIFQTSIEDNTIISSQSGEHLEIDTNTSPTGFNDSALVEVLEANVVKFDNNDEHNNLDISSSDIHMTGQIESGIFFPSGIVSALSTSMMESDVTTRCPSWIPRFNMTSNKGLSQVSYFDVLYQSSCLASEDIKEAPPLPPLPPLEWRSVKLRDNSPSSFGISFQNVNETNSLVAPPPVQCHSVHASLPEDEKMVLSSHSSVSIPTFKAKILQESSLEPRGKWEVPQESSQCPPVVHDEHDESCQLLEERSMDISRASLVTSLHYENISFGPDETIEPKLEPSFAPSALETKSSQHLPIVEFEIFHDSENINLNNDGHRNLTLVGSAVKYDEDHGGSGTLNCDNDHFSSLEPSKTATLEISHPANAALPEETQSSHFGLLWKFEDERPNVRPCSVRNRPRDPLIEAVAAHDRSTLRKVSELVWPLDDQKTDERNSMLEQIRNKAFSLRPAVATKQNIKGPSTNLKVAAIIEKANAIRQACVGSDEDDDADSWSDS